MASDHAGEYIRLIEIADADEDVARSFIWEELEQKLKGTQKPTVYTVLSAQYYIRRV